MSVEFPKHIPQWQGAKVFFDNIICAKPAEKWEHHEIDAAAFLANDEARLAGHEVALLGEGEIIRSHSGNAVANPRCAVMQNLRKVINEARKTLMLYL